MTKKTMGVIGATGNMGQALSEKLYAEGHHVLGQGRTEYSREIVLRLADEFTTNIHEVLLRSDVVFVAVKPQVFRELDFGNRLPFQVRGVVVSVMAGISMAELRDRIGTLRVIRSMPNLASTVGAGVTAWMADRSVTKKEKALVTGIFDMMGSSLELRQEDLFHTFTALTGSGPGLLAQICDWFSQAATEHGLQAAEAETLLWSVLQGMTMLHDQKRFTFEELRQRVTSPNGTTHQGLEALREAGVDETMQACFDAARARSEVLGNSFWAMRGRRWYNKRNSDPSTLKLRRTGEEE